MKMRRWTRGNTKIGKTTYEFDNEGVLSANGAVLMGTTYRLADQNGILVETPGWALVAGNWYYVLDDGSLYTGILEKMMLPTILHRRWRKISVW